MFVALAPIAIPAPVIVDAKPPVAPCVEFGDPQLALTGTLFSRTYFGPPFWGERRAEDRREEAALLLLDAPICARVEAAADPTTALRTTWCWCS